MRVGAVSVYLVTVMRISLLKHVLTCNHEVGNNTVNCTALSLIEVPSNSFEDVVTVLILTTNSLDMLDNDCFGEYPNLSTLYLKNNKLKIVQKKAFRGLDNLVVLDLSRNNLTRFYETTFEGNQKLETLNLSDNPLQMTSRPFIVSQSLRTLILSGANLTSISSHSFSGLKNLELLDLKSNSLKIISPDFFHQLRRLSQVYLRGNPWRCDGDLEQLMLSKQDVIADYKKIHCVTPDGEQRVWSQGRWKTTLLIASTETWIQEALETSSSEAVALSIVVTSSPDSRDEEESAVDSAAADDDDNLDDVGTTVHSAAADDVDNKDDTVPNTNINNDSSGVEVSSTIVIYMYVGMIAIIFIAAGIAIFLMRRMIWTCLTEASDRKSCDYQSVLRRSGRDTAQHRNSEQRPFSERIYESIVDLSST